MNTTENNKLIAEFMGKYYINLKFEVVSIISASNHKFPFDKDWNWLMEVVEKIESLGGGIEIYNNYCKIIYDDEIISEIEENYKIEAVYNACMEFIKWYNQNEQKEENIKFARQCSITGEGMNRGYVISEGDFYIKDDSALLEKYIVENTKYKYINDAYADEFYYWTEWEDEDDYQFEMINGVLTEIL